MSWYSSQVSLQNHVLFRYSKCDNWHSNSQVKEDQDSEREEYYIIYTDIN